MCDTDGLVFELFTVTLIHFLAKWSYPEGLGVYSVRNTLGNSGEVGILREVFFVVGVWIFSGTTIAIYQ